MFRIFKKNKPVLLGIDIGTTSVRLLELSKHENKFRIESYGIEYLPANAVIEKEIKDIEAVGYAIERLVRSSRPSSRKAAVAVSSSGIISKVIQMPASLTEDEIETQLQVDAEKYIPYAIDEVNLDFDILGRGDDEDSVKVLLVAAKSSYVDSRVEALEIAGLEAKVVDTEVYAVERAFKALAPGMLSEETNNPGNLTAIIDIGSTVTNIDILCNGIVIYNREITFGSYQLIKQIKERYELSDDEAYIAKKENKLPEDYQQEVFIPFREDVVHQIRRGLQMFFSSTSYRHVDLILLAGGCAFMDGLLPAIYAQLNTPAIILDPVSQMTFSNKVLKKECQRDSPGLLVCTGLAMRSFL